METEHASHREAERVDAEDVIAAHIVGHGAEPEFLLQEIRRVERVPSTFKGVGKGVRVITDGKRAVVSAV